MPPTPLFVSTYTNLELSNPIETLTRRTWDSGCMSSKSDSLQWMDCERILIITTQRKRDCATVIMFLKRFSYSPSCQLSVITTQQQQQLPSPKMTLIAGMVDMYQSTTGNEPPLPRLQWIETHCQYNYIYCDFNNLSSSLESGDQRPSPPRVAFLRLLLIKTI